MQRDAVAHPRYTAIDGVAPGFLANLPIDDADRRLLAALALRVRFLTLRQIVRAPWCGVLSEAHARRRAARLESLGLVRRARVMSHPVIPLNAPLTTWTPGGERPDFGAVGYAAGSRWTQGHQVEQIVFATERTADAAGGHPGRPPKASEATHDMHLAAIYLRFRETRPEAAETWRPESHILAGRRRVYARRRRRIVEKLPDAFIVEGGRTTFVEFAGAYTRDRVRAFHSYCEEKGIGYELW